MLRIENLSKKYDRKILDEIDLSIDEPGIYALVGPNGMGKTTFMDAIAGLINKDGGKVKICGIDNSDSKIFNHLAYARNTEMLYSNLTALDHFRLVEKSMQAKEEDFKNALAVFGVEDFMKKKVLSYSTGMKQKALLTCSFIGDYDIYMMDEPVSGLDPSAIITLRNHLKKLASQGKIVIFSPHTLSEVDQLTNEVFFLKDGNIINKNLEDYKKNYYEISYQKNGLKSKKVKKDRLDQELKEIYQNKAKIVDISEVNRSTEDLYLEIYA